MTYSEYSVSWKSVNYFKIKNKGHTWTAWWSRKQTLLILEVKQTNMKLIDGELLYKYKVTTIQINRLIYSTNME